MHKPLLDHYSQSNSSIPQCHRTVRACHRTECSSGANIGRIEMNRSANLHRASTKNRQSDIHRRNDLQTIHRRQPGMLHGHGASSEMGVSLDSECPVQVIVAALSPASLPRNSEDLPSLKMRISARRFPTEGATYVCYT